MRRTKANRKDAKSAKKSEESLEILARFAPSR